MLHSLRKCTVTLCLVGILWLLLGCDLSSAQKAIYESSDGRVIVHTANPKPEDIERDGFTFLVDLDLPTDNLEEGDGYRVWIIPYRHSSPDYPGEGFISPWYYSSSVLPAHASNISRGGWLGYVDTNDDYIPLRRGTVESWRIIVDRWDSSQSENIGYLQDSFDYVVTETEGGSSGTLTSEQQQNLAIEFLNALNFCYTMMQIHQPSGITLSVDNSTLTFTDYTLSSYYDTAMSAGSLGTTTYIGSGSVFNGTMSGNYESTTGISTTIADMTITDSDIPGGSVTIAMNLSIDNTNTVDSFTMALNGTAIDTVAASTYVNLQINSDIWNSDIWLDFIFGEPGTIEATQSVNSTVRYTLEEDEIHWITFAAASGTSYVLQTLYDDDNLDTVMTLRSPGGVPVATNDDNEDIESYTPYSKITFRANTTGTFYVGILGYAGAAGSYWLSITTAAD